MPDQKKQQKKQSKITKYPGSLNLNIGMLIFAVILVYIIVSVVTYFRTRHVVGYEVMEGSLSSNNIYRGLALRQERIVDSESSGNVNYFASEGGRVAVGNLVYTIDESGELLDLLRAQGTDSVQLSSEDLSELRTQIVSFASGFDPEEFSTTYDFRIGIQGTVQKLANTNVLENIESLNRGSRAQAIHYYNAAYTGIVLYSVDGFEQTTASDVTEEMLQENDYEKTQLVGNRLVETGDPVYKLCTSENWSIVIPVEAERAQELAERGYIKVRFLKNQDESWAQVFLHSGMDGGSYVELAFTNSMRTFCTDRFLNIELILQEERGLKIPNSSIVEKSFYLVPKEFVTTGADGSRGVLRDAYLEDGTRTTEFVSTQIYSETETDYYVDVSFLRPGDILVKPDSDETYTVSLQDSLLGVYNINKGYADFRQIHVLYQNSEYSIVESNTQYGLNVYDYIVLDTSTVDENELIYQ